jgi:chitodextrinase
MARKNIDFFSTSGNPSICYLYLSKITIMKKLLLTLLFVPFIGALNSNAQGGQCQAMFQYTMGACPEIMFYDGSYTQDSLDQIVSWSWDFGDQNTANTPNASNVYQSNGTYTVCLTIITSSQCVSSYCDTISINCIGQSGCEAAFQYSSDSICPSFNFYDGSTATAGIAEWFYDFGDGNTSTSSNPTNTYDTNGSYLVCLTVTGNDSCVSTFCDTVVVDCIIGINEIQHSNFVLSPNPAVNEITLDFENANSLDYSIIGMNGAIYNSGHLGTAASHTINVSELEAGIYLLEFKKEGIRSVARFIKK